MQEKLIMARQPIFNEKIEVVAYELLFRQVDPTGVMDGDNATSEILVDVFTHLNVDDVIGDKKAYVNFTRKLLAEPPPFDKSKIVIEVLEDIPIDDYLVTHLSSLYQEGYTVALDDFEYTEAAQAVIPFASVVKVDVLALNKQQIADHAKILGRHKVTLLAEKVEDHEMFEFCKGLGFTLFQGFFLCKPEIIEGKKIPASKLVVLELLSKLQNPETPFEDLSDLITRDPVMSYKTLRLVNSACYAPKQKIESIPRAIAYLGLDKIKGLATLMALSKLSDKPSALQDQAILRAKLCELLGEVINRVESSTYFSVGLLSTLDAYFDQPLKAVVGNLSLHEDILQALLAYEGPFGKILETVLNLERANFNEINWDYLRSFNITPELINQKHTEAVSWYERSASLEN